MCTRTKSISLLDIFFNVESHEHFNVLIRRGVYGIRKTARYQQNREVGGQNSMDTTLRRGYSK